MTWDEADADIRFRVFEDATRTRVGTATGLESAAEWTGVLDDTLAYYLGIWSASGRSDYTATITADTTAAPLEITAQPVDVTVTEGDDATFTVTATGTGALSFQWFDSDNAIAGQTSDTLTINATSLADSGSEFRVSVIDENNGLAISEPAVLTVEEAQIALDITAQPTDVTVIEGDDATFTVAATGAGTLAYQWMLDGVPLAGQTSDTLVISPTALTDSGNQYAVSITDDNSSVDSDAATLTIEAIDFPVTIADLGQGTLDSERNAGPRWMRLNFDSLVTDTHTITVSWDSDADIRFAVFDNSGNRISNRVIRGQSPGVWVGELVDQTQYYISLWSNAGVGNFIATIEASIPVSIESQPSSLTVTEGDDATFSVFAAGSGALSYQWFANGNALVGETSESLTIFATSLNEDDTVYAVQVSNGFESATSDEVLLTVIEPDDNVLGPLTTATSPSWELELFRSPVSTRPDGRPIYETNEQAWAALTVGDVVYVGGDFTNIRNGALDADPAIQYIAAFDRITGEPLPGFDIELNGPVHSLEVSPDNNTLYIGGGFTVANGEFRKSFAAYDIGDNNQTLSSLRPQKNGSFINPNLAVREIAVTEDRLYLAGPFTQFSGDTDYAFVAAFDRESGEIIESFKPKPNKRVFALITDGDEGVWLGGIFTRMDGVAKVGLALVSPTTGELLTHLPEVPYMVIDLASTPTQLFVATGGQNRVNRFTGNVAGAINRQTLETQWELQGNGDVQAVDVDQGRYVYFGGHYQLFRFIRNSETPPDGRFVTNGQLVERLSRHDKVTGEIDFTWTPFVSGIRSVNGIDVLPDGLYVVGDFLKVGGDAADSNDPRRNDHRGFAIFRGRTE